MICPRCDGTGVVIIGYQSVSLHHREPIVDPCDECMGEAQDCPGCDGCGCDVCEGAGAYSIPVTP